MAGWRRAVELAMTGEEIERLTALSRSRTEPASRVSRAQMLLAYRENPSFCAVGQRVGVHHQTVQRCVERALGYGVLAAIEDRPRPGKEPVITPASAETLPAASSATLPINVLRRVMVIMSSYARTGENRNPLLPLRHSHFRKRRLLLAIGDHLLNIGQVSLRPSG